MAKHRIFTTSVASVYPHYLAKAAKKGRTKAEVDGIIRWLTGDSQAALEKCFHDKTNFETFFADAPALNPARALVKGEIRYLNKLIDELGKGKPMDKILQR